jgi:hypothetical protein
MSLEYLFYIHHYSYKNDIVKQEFQEFHCISRIYFR